MPDVKRTLKLITQQSILPNQAAPDGEDPTTAHPMRSWSVSIHLLNAAGDELPPTCYDKAVYILHESFGKRARQTVRSPNFALTETGWGEFVMSIHLSPLGAPKAADHILSHDLNFNDARYESTHNVTFRNPKPDLLAALRESGPVGDAAGGPAPAAGAASMASATKPPKRKPHPRNTHVELEKLAETLPLLHEDDLLQVVQMVHDNKSDNTYTKNDLENGEFHVDLYTLPDPLIKLLWDFANNRLDAGVEA